VCEGTIVEIGRIWKTLSKEDKQLIELVLMILRTPLDIFISTFHTNWKECKEYCRDYTFEDLGGLLIIDQNTLLDEGNIGGKHQSHFPKGKGKSNNKEIEWFDIHIQSPRFLD
jgi:hypothetical protein